MQPAGILGLCSLALQGRSKLYEKIKISQDGFSVFFCVRQVETRTIVSKKKLSVVVDPALNTRSLVSLPDLHFKTSF
jgi:hypothetical protein